MTTRNAQAIGHQHRRRSIVDRVRRPVLAAAAFIASLVIGSVVCLTLVATFPLLIGWSSAAIASGSMAPALNTGDILVSSAPDDRSLRSGAIITFTSSAGALATHRIVEAGSDGGYITKGDANLATDTDRVHRADVVGVARLRVPLIGWPIVWLRHGDVFSFVVFVSMLALCTVVTRMSEPQLP